MAEVAFIVDDVDVEEVAELLEEIGIMFETQVV